MDGDLTRDRSANQLRPLPRLREDLVLQRSAPSADGSSWLIHDALQHRYLQIDAATFTLALALARLHDSRKS